MGEEATGGITMAKDSIADTRDEGVAGEEKIFFVYRRREWRIEALYLEKLAYGAIYRGYGQRRRKYN
jgi:hypothetical protein